MQPHLMWIYCYIWDVSQERGRQGRRTVSPDQLQGDRDRQERSGVGWRVQKDDHRQKPQAR